MLTRLLTRGLPLGGARWLSGAAAKTPALLDTEQEAMLLRVFRSAGPLSKRQLAEVLSKGGLAQNFPSKARIDRHIKHLKKQGTLVVHRTPGLPGKFAISPDEDSSRANSPP